MDLGYRLQFSGPTRPMDQNARLTIVAAHSSVENNFYGAGNYFAIDPRLATYFETASRGHGRAQRTPRERFTQSPVRLLVRLAAFQIPLARPSAFRPPVIIN